MPSRALAATAVAYKDVKNVHTSSGTQVHLHESEQVFGGVAHELYRSAVPSTMALP